MKKVHDYIKQNNLLSKGDNIILGVSGGADSVCLLYILCDLREEYALNISVVHINHMIRETAGRDEVFTERLCGELKADFTAVSTNCPEIAQRDGLSLEEAGRNERYRIFRETGDKKFGKDNYKIAVAHHMDDLAETLIFNMARGTGINGLASIKPRNGNIIRPLLCLSKAEIEENLKKLKAKHMDDETNDSDDYARNKIRHRIVPIMNELSEKAVSHMASTAEQLGEIEDYLNIQTDELWDKYVSVKESIFIRQGIMCEHPALIKRVIHRALCKTAGRARDISAVQIEAVLNLFGAETSRKRDLIYNMEALREYEGVKIFVKSTTDEEYKKELLSKLKFKVTDRDFSQNIPTDLYTKWFDYDKIKNCPNVRFRTEGDYLTIDSKDSKKLLSDYMTNEKIPHSKRDEIPLLADGNHIMWVVGYRISNYYKVGPETKKILAATYEVPGTV